jgi:hypothetical protein
LRRTSILAVLALGATCTGCGGDSASTPPPRATTLVTDRSIAGIFTGDARERAEQMLGVGTSVEQADSLEEVEYPTFALSVTSARADGDGPFEVFQVFTKDTRYRTRLGNGVGSTIASVRAEEGIECVDTVCAIGLTPESPGLVFQIEKGRVTELILAANDERTPAAGPRRPVEA